MRVLLASESYLPYLSGVTVSVDALARGLGARGHQVLVLAPRPVDDGVLSAGSPGPEPGYAWLGSYQLPRLAPASYRMAWPNPWSPALRQARAFRPDVVHAHSPFLTGLLARAVARHASAPFVFTHHTRFDDYGHYLGPLGRAGIGLTGAYLRRFWSACEAVIAPSSDLAAEIRERLPGRARHHVHVLPTGVDVDGIRAVNRVDPRAEAGWPPDAVVAASLGRLAPEKGVELLLEAVALALAEAPELRLLLVGGGPSEAALRIRASRPDLEGRVHLTGLLARDEALARIAGADLFAFASRTETQGLVLAEAFAAGLPALAVDGPGVRDSVRDGLDGHVVAATPPDTLASRFAAELARLTRDTDARHALAVRAAADAERFSVHARVAEAEALYASLLR